MNKYTIKLLLVFCLLTFSSQIIQASIFKKKTLKIDENGLKQGWLITYWDDEQKIVCMISYFKDGKESKVNKNYSSKGKRLSKFRYYKNRIRVKHYDEEGRITQKGWAKMNFTTDEIRFYWEGKWKFYNKFRTKISESEYLDGNMISEKSFIK